MCKERHNKYFRFLEHVEVTFPVAMIKCLNTSDLRRKRFNLVHSSKLQPIVVEMMQQLEAEAAEHTAFTVKRQK